jgi:tRNA A-37 threonylcarbamoyl transferase component Bud32
MGDPGSVTFAGAGGLRWTADAAEAEWVRRVLAPDPGGIGRLPGATIAKENSVRSVRRVPREGLPAVFVKRFRVSPIRDAVKYLFVPSRARAEWDASRGLRAAGIQAAEVVAFAERRAGGVLRDAACVVREFPDALELVPWMFRRFGQEGPWTAAQEAARRALLDGLGRLLRSIHDAGFRHPDLHGGNLLLAKEGDPPAMCVIDLHTVRRGTPERQGDLATLLHSMLTATTAEERTLLRRAYDGDRPALPALGEESWHAVLAAMEEDRVRSRTRCSKLFRPTGRYDTARRGDLSLVFLRERGPDTFLAALEAHRRTAADPSSKAVLKRGGRSTVTRVEVPGPGGPLRLVVKETKVRGALDLLKNALRPPRAVGSWVAGNGLWHRHLDVAEPRALAVRGTWPVRRESFLVMEDVAAGGERFDLRSLRLWGGAPLGRDAARAKRDEVERLGRVVGGLHARGIYHGDLKAVNLFVRPKHGRDSFCLVDYDRVAFGTAAVPFPRRVKNLAQLAASLGDYFTRTDRLRFYRAYAEALPGAWDARKALSRAVAEACARKIVVRRRPIE